MESGAKPVGHPVHQMLVVFSLGLLATAVIFDVVTLWRNNPEWSIAGCYMMCAGIVGGLLAAVFGLIDWLAVPSGTQAKATGAWHGIGNINVMPLFACSWSLRFDDRVHPATGS